MLAIGLALFAILSDGLSQGSFFYGNGEIDNSPTYAIDDPCDPGGSKTLVVGPGYSAQIWYSVGDVEIDLSLRPLEAVTGLFDQRGGLWFRPGIIFVPDTYGGDLVTLQIRAWENRNGVINSWEQALADSTVAIGKTPLIRDAVILAGFRRDGTIALGHGDLFYLRPAFTLSAVCPEPSSYLLVGMTAIMCSFLRKRRR